MPVQKNKPKAPATKKPTVSEPKTVSTEEKGNKNKFTEGKNPRKVADDEVEKWGEFVEHLGEIKLRQLVKEKTLDAIQSQIDEAESLMHECDNYVRSLSTGVASVNETINDSAAFAREKLKQEDKERIIREIVEEQERKRKEAEKKAREEKEERERKAREKKERQRLAAEKRKKDEEERKHQEEERRKREEEEARRRAEEEERRRQEEEERKAEEERQRKLEEDRLRKLENERKEREAEERRKEQERLRKERGAKEAEERQRREEEEEKIRIEAEKNDPLNWPTFIYRRTDGPDDLGTDFTCVVRSRPDVAPSLKKEQLDCMTISSSECHFPENFMDEVMSNIVNVQAVDDSEDLKFERPVHIAIPCAKVPKSASRELVLRINTGSGDWTDVTASEAVLKEDELAGTKFLEATFESLNTLQLVVVRRLKDFADKFDKRGGEHKSVVNDKVCLRVPSDAFITPTDVALQVIPTDTITLAGLRSKKQGCENVRNITPLVKVTAERNPKKKKVPTATLR